MTVRAAHTARPAALLRSRGGRWIGARRPCTGAERVLTRAFARRTWCLRSAQLAVGVLDAAGRARGGGDGLAAWVLGDGLEAVLAEGCEVDQQVDGVGQPVLSVFLRIEHRFVHATGVLSDGVARILQAFLRIRVPWL